MDDIYTEYPANFRLKRLGPSATRDKINIIQKDFTENVS